MKFQKILRSPWMLVLLAAVFFLLLSDGSSYRQEGVTMTVVEDSVTSRSVTVDILNTTDRVLSNAGQWETRYRIQRRFCGLWLPMRQAKRPGGEVCATLPSCYYEKDIPQRITLYWRDACPFDALAPGRYRLILNFYEDGGEAFSLAAEFLVES